jgi:uncharacterized protein (TIGR00297 family)
MTAMMPGAVAAGVGMAFGLFAWRMRYLTPSGAVAGGLFAFTLIGLGGWGWMVPGFTFFFLSSAISKAASRAGGRRRQIAEADESRRDAAQVLANGGVAWLLVIVHALAPGAWAYWGFVGSLAAAAADTWATEIGSLSRRPPRMILSGRPVEPGTSGAVSGVGTLAGIAGALAIWASAWWTAPEAALGVGIGVSASAVVGGGVLGSLADSVAGATIQAAYRDPRDGRVVDGRRGVAVGRERVRGWRVVDNDVVNGVCTAVGAAVAAGVVALG